MPAQRKKERVIGRFFTWLVGSRHGIYFADGRSNTPKLGRHSLGTRDKKEALQLLVRLDLVKAVEHGRAERSLLESQGEDLLALDDGQRLYLEYVGRPAVLGGATPGTLRRYRAILGKFVAFAQKAGVRHWQQASKNLLEAYGAWLDDRGYDYATEYLELTTVKQVVKWLASEKKIPASCVFALPLRKPQGTTTYCYAPEEVAAIVRHCSADPARAWLGEVVIALATTGLRISELAALHWTDVETNLIRLVDTHFQASKGERATARTTKSHRDRSLPIHPDLKRVLEGMDRHPDGLIFHGPRGGVLKPDTVRNVLIREVLTPLAERFPTRAGGTGFIDGRLHSFRHFFCSLSANSGVPEQVLMTWLGHRDSKMVRHYYHLHPEEAQRQMARIRFLGKAAPETG
jgi:integrase